jgi:hypothetical protein
MAFGGVTTQQEFLEQDWRPRQATTPAPLIGAGLPPQASPLGPLALAFASPPRLARPLPAGGMLCVCIGVRHVW